LPGWRERDQNFPAQFEKDGYKPWWNVVEITVFGMDKAPKEVRVGDATLHEWRYDAAQHAVVFTVPEAKEQLDAGIGILTNLNRAKRY